MEKWKLRWSIACFGDEEEFDTFEEAKSVFRKKISREVSDEWFDVLDSLEDDLEEETDGEEIMNFLKKFADNELEESDVIETEYHGNFHLTINADGIDMAEDENYGQQVYPTISSNFIFMDDPNKVYRFEFIDYYDYDLAPGTEFNGYGYCIILEKVTD